MDEETSVDMAQIIDRYEGDPGMLIPMMQDVQEECGYLPQTQLKELSGRLCLPLSRVYSVAGFYSSFRLMPKGDHTIQLCMGTVCFLKGADKISEAIQKEFDLVPGGTSPDRRFTFAPVNCVGACALAPVMVVDGEYFGGLTVETAVEHLAKIAAQQKPEEVKDETREDAAPSGQAAAAAFSAKQPKKKKAAKKKTAKKKDSGSEEK